MGISRREEHGSHSKHNDMIRRRRILRKAKLHKPIPRLVARSGSASTGCTPPGTIMPDQSAVKEKSSRAWENIVLHYLSKLKKVWRPDTPVNENEMIHPVTPGNRETSASKFRRERHNEHRKMHYTKYNPPSPTVSTVPSDFCLSGKRKAFNIVANAIEYGLANGIVSKNGNFFWLSHKLKKNRRLRSKRSVCSNCRTCRELDGVITMESRTNSAVDMEKDNLGHGLAVNKARPKVSKAKSILLTNNLKVKQVPRSRPRSARSMRSVKSRKSRIGINTPKSIPKDTIALTRSKSKKKSVTRVTSAIRNEYMTRLARAKTKEHDCRCPRCLKKYNLW